MVQFIGQDVTIGAYSIIGSNVSIGDGTIVDSHTVIEGKTTIGQNNHIFFLMQPLEPFLKI